MFRRTALCLLLLTMAAAGTSAQPPGSDPWFRTSPRPRDFRPALLPWKIFSVDFPNDWQLVPGFGPILVTAADKSRGNQPAGAIVLEHTSLVEPLGPAEVDANLAQLEADFIRGRDPAGQNFQHEAKDVNKQRFVLVQYVRPGFNGLDRVAVYAMPVGRVMYRLICIAPEKELARYQPICAHVAATFKATPSQ